MLIGPFSLAEITAMIRLGTNQIHKHKHNTKRWNLNYIFQKKENNNTSVFKFQTHILQQFSIKEKEEASEGLCLTGGAGGGCNCNWALPQGCRLLLNLTTSSRRWTSLVNMSLSSWSVVTCPGTSLSLSSSTLITRAPGGTGNGGAMLLSEESPAGCATEDEISTIWRRRRRAAVE